MGNASSIARGASCKTSVPNAELSSWSRFTIPSPTGGEEDKPDDQRGDSHVDRRDDDALERCYSHATADVSLRLGAHAAQRRRSPFDPRASDELVVGVVEPRERHGQGEHQHREHDHYRRHRS